MACYQWVLGVSHSSLYNSANLTKDYPGVRLVLACYQWVLGSAQYPNQADPFPATALAEDHPEIRF